MDNKGDIMPGIQTSSYSNKERGMNLCARNSGSKTDESPPFSKILNLYGFEDVESLLRKNDDKEVLDEVFIATTVRKGCTNCSVRKEYDALMRQRLDSVEKVITPGNIYTGVFYLI